MEDNDSSDSEQLHDIEYPEQTNLVFRYDDPSSLSGIIRAVVEDDLFKIQALLKSGKSVNVNDNHGNTALHVAVLKEKSKIFDYLISQKTIHVDHVNFYGETPLFLSVKSGKAEFAKKLLDIGGRVNISNNEDVSPLHVSVRHPTITKMLIKYGADLNSVDFDGNTPLHDAVAEENLEVVCMLLYYNVDATVQCSEGLTAFMKALISENILIQEALFEYTDDFNRKTSANMSILSLALTHDTPFVPEILNRGAEVLFNNGFEIDTLECCLRVPNCDNFRLVCEKYFSKNHYLDDTVFHRIYNSSLTDDEFLTYLKTVVNNRNLTEIGTGVATVWFLGSTVLSCYEHSIPLDEVTIISLLLLTLGVNVYPEDLDVVYDYYGYCHLFKFLLHFPIYVSESCENVFPRLIYDVQRDPITIFHEYIQVFLIQHDGVWLPKQMHNMLDYYIYPPIREKLQHYFDLFPNKMDPLFIKISKLPPVPLLLDLARNATRTHLCKRFNLDTSCKFYTFLHHWHLPSVYKKILAYEEKIYKKFL